MVRRIVINNWVFIFIVYTSFSLSPPFTTILVIISVFKTTNSYNFNCD